MMEKRLDSLGGWTVLRSDLELLRLTLGKAHLPMAVVTPAELLATLGEEIPLSEGRTLYKFRDALGLLYLYLSLGTDEILLIGPYARALPNEAALAALAARQGLPPRAVRHLREYCEGVTVLEEGNPLFFLIESFCERLFGTRSFRTVGLDGDGVLSPLVPRGARGEETEEILVGMRAMERRYEFENALMEAVTHGQLHKEGAILASLGSQPFEQRLPDSLRNAKNYSIIMNTLLRKAAERGGVHPFYLDRVSSELAARIEGMPSVTESAGLMREMFRTYCLLVQRHAGREYSPIVKKTVLLIHSHLAEAITPRTLAVAQGVSPGYLSTVFRRETGKTISAYTREERIKHAAYLLSSTDRQVQAVALDCGIMDAQYFTKLFKQATGRTPNEYRREASGGRA